MSTDKSTLKLPSAAVVSTILVPSTEIVAASTGLPNSSTTIPFAITNNGAIELWLDAELDAGELEGIELGAMELEERELDAIELGATTLDATELAATELSETELAAIELGTITTEVKELDSIELEELESSTEDDAGAAELVGIAASEPIARLDISLDRVLESADEIIAGALLADNELIDDELPVDALFEPPPQADNPTTINRHNTCCV